MDLGQMIHGLSEVFPWEWQAVIIRHQAQTLGMRSAWLQVNFAC